eukprot:m.448050 g.448050  ORF g.448050 m.448050 type:complete len:365 (+) comp21505_c1_seq6:5836-6930(+)
MWFSQSPSHRIVKHSLRPRHSTYVVGTCRQRSGGGEWDTGVRTASLLQHLRGRPLKRFEGLHERARHQTLLGTTYHDDDASDADDDIAYASGQSMQSDHASASLLPRQAETQFHAGGHAEVQTLSHHTKRRKSSTHAQNSLRSDVGLQLCRQFRYLRALQYIALFSYESLTEEAMQIVNRIKVGSCGHVLAAYPAIRSDNPAYTPLLAIAIVLLVYAAAFPIGLWWFLRHYCGCGGGTKKATDSKLILQAKYGVLFDHFKPEFWWWEVQVLFRRMVLLAVYVAKYSDVHERAYDVYVVSFVILMFHVMSQPYKQAKDNLVETISLGTLVYAAVTKSTSQSRTVGLTFFPLALVMWELQTSAEYT